MVLSFFKPEQTALFLVFFAQFIDTHFQIRYINNIEHNCRTILKGRMIFRGAVVKNNV